MENKSKFNLNPKLRLMDQAESGIMGTSGRVDYGKKPAPIFCAKRKEITFKDLSFFQDDARKKRPLKGIKYADNLYRCLVSAVRKASRKILKPSFSDNMLSE